MPECNFRKLCLHELDPGIETSLNKRVSKLKLASIYDANAVQVCLHTVSVHLSDILFPFSHKLSRKVFDSRRQYEKCQSKDWHFSYCRGAGNRTRTTRSQTAYTTTMLHPDVARVVKCEDIQYF